MKFKLLFFLFYLILCIPMLKAQGIMKDDDAAKETSLSPMSHLANIPSRNLTSLNGKWQVIIDPYDFGIGSWAAIYKDQKPKGKTDFYEYAFDGATFDVPGDFNSQMPELHFFEGTVWYKKTFSYHKNSAKKLFIHFGAVNYKTDVFLNSQKIGCHEGGFTPFQFELTDLLKEGENSIILRVNNQRYKDGIPSLGFDWFNYGGITRDVNLVETPASYIEDYFIQLDKSNPNQIKGWVRLNGKQKNQKVQIKIPEAKIAYRCETDENGFASFTIPVKLQLWTPEQPKLYQVQINSLSDDIKEDIGFRNITVNGTSILLNGKPVFLRGVSFHEEIPQDQRRAYSESDALTLLTWAKELGCNFVRLAHYPQNEHTVRMAEKMGIMMWEEIPVYQGIDFGSQTMQKKMNHMLDEMLERDKNKCGIIIWSLSNETSPGTARNHAIINMAEEVRKKDPTRLITSAFNKIDYEGSTISIRDTLSRYLDVLAVNEYLGWYKPWPDSPEKIVWKSDFNKPLIMSEFGGEALYGNHGANDVASSWSEEYQEKLYQNQLAMLQQIPFLAGVCPWVLADFRSPRRLHPQYQDGLTGMWNRKGLLSDKGFKKKAWYVIRDFYDKKDNNR